MNWRYCARFTEAVNLKADLQQPMLTLETQLREQQAVGRLYDTALHNLVLHRDSETLYGREAVVADWLTELHSCGEQQVLESEAFSAPAPNANAQLVMTHSRISAMHTGASGWLPRSTGKPISYRSQSLYLVAHERIVEQWRFEDQLHIALQLGLAPADLAKRQSPLNGGRWQLGETASAQGQTGPRIAGLPKVDHSDDIVSQWVYAFNTHRLDRLGELYCRDADLSGPGGRELIGRADITKFWLSLQAAIPDGQLLTQKMVRDTDNGRIGLLWSLSGFHTGPGLTPTPSGQRLRLAGLTQWQLNDGGIAKEWTLFNEIDLLRQIHSGSRQTPNRL
jgi:predicted ester cyclase